MRKLIAVIVSILLLPSSVFSGSIVYSGTGGSVVFSGSSQGSNSTDTGFVEFTAAASVFGTGSTIGWTNASNALTNIATNSNASAIDSGDLSYYLNLTNASASLSGLTGTTIDGIELELSATGNDSGSSELYDETIQLMIGGSRTGTNKAIATQWTDTVVVTRTYGGATDLWGLTPTPEQLMATDFGISLRFLSDGGSSATMRVYLARIKIYYTGSPGSVVTTGYGFECDPTGVIGTTTRNSANGNGANTFVYSNFTTGSNGDTAGTITHCWARINNISGATGATIGVYETDGTLLADHNFASAGTTEAWQGGELSEPVCLQPTTTYNIGMVTTDGSWNVFFDSSETGVNVSTSAMTYATSLSNTNFSGATVTLTDQAAMFMCNDTGVPPS